MRPYDGRWQSLTFLKTKLRDDIGLLEAEKRANLEASIGSDAGQDVVVKLVMISFDELGAILIMKTEKHQFVEEEVREAE